MTFSFSILDIFSPDFCRQFYLEKLFDAFASVDEPLNFILFIYITSISFLFFIDFICEFIFFQENIYMIFIQYSFKLVFPLDILYSFDPNVSDFVFTNQRAHDDSSLAEYVPSNLSHIYHYQIYPNESMNIFGLFVYISSVRGHLLSSMFHLHSFQIHIYFNLLIHHSFQFYMENYSSLFYLFQIICHEYSRQFVPSFGKYW